MMNKLKMNVPVDRVAPGGSAAPVANAAPAIEWPWRGQLTGTLVPGARVGIMDGSRRLVTTAAVRPDGSFVLPALPAGRDGVRLCVLLPGALPVCGAEGDPTPVLQAPGISIQVKKAVTNKGVAGY